MKRNTLVYSKAGADGVKRSGVTSGQSAKTLSALVSAGRNGVSAKDCDAWTSRLAAYCHNLRRKHGLEIVTEREEHPGGWHGRRGLITICQVTPASD
jgi:hypothetical protein